MDLRPLVPRNVLSGKKQLILQYFQYSQHVKVQYKSYNNIVSANPSNQFLSRSPPARIAMFLLALPSFLISTSFLIIVPTTYMSWPPKSVSEAIGWFVLCEFFAAGSFFTMLSMLWSIATPRWIGNLIESSSRRLIKITGIFLVTGGLGMIAPIIMYKQAIHFILAPVSIMLGIRLLYVASRDAKPISRESA